MRIGGLMRREAEKKIATMKKLRFLKGSEFGEKEYIVPLKQISPNSFFVILQEMQKTVS